MNRPAIFLTTEYGSQEAEGVLNDRGLGEVEPGLLNFIDAFNETIEASVSERPDTVYADCNDLSSIDIAISKLDERMGKKDILLVIDSLTSPYLFSGSGILRFIRQTLSRFAARGNAVLACIDEGCGRSEDLVSMMSLSNGFIKIEPVMNERFFNVVKYPKMTPTRIKVPIASIGRKEHDVDDDALRRFVLAVMRGDESDLHSSGLSLREAQRLLAHDDLHTYVLFNELAKQEKSKFSQLVVRALEEYIRQNRSVNIDRSKIIN
jgi:hypothetical protein